MNANRYEIKHITCEYFHFQVNQSLPKLAPEVVEEIFDRCLLNGSMKLYFEDFEKAVIMASMVFFPGAHAACAYTSLADQAIMFLPSLRAAHFPDTNLERVASVADALLEKSVACTFRPPSSYCSACTWPDTDVRSPARRKPMKRAQSPIELATVPNAVSEISVPVYAQPSQAEPSPSVVAVRDPGENTFRNISPVRRSRKKSTAEEEAEPLPPPPRRSDTHQTACDFEDALLRHFGSPEVAFQFLDNTTGNCTGQISATKFRYAWKTMGMDGDMRSVFRYIDVDCDGAIDETDFRTWRSVREKQRDQRLVVSLPNSS
jgi:hypothetical protein